MESMELHHLILHILLPKIQYPLIYTLNLELHYKQLTFEDADMSS